MQALGWVNKLCPYVAISGLVTLLDFAVYSALVVQIALEPAVANVCSWMLAVPVAYLLHSVVTFSARRSWRSFAHYTAVCISTLVLGTFCVWLSGLFVNPFAAKAIAVVVVFSVSFALSHSVVFAKV